MSVRVPLMAERFLKRLEEGGFSAHLVGGAVRDALLGAPFSDLDVATSATPDEVARLFSDCRVVETGLLHGTVTVLFDDGVSAEITTYRREGAYTDARHPDTVTFVSDVRQDLARRDFTVGAMALSLDGSLIDPFGGREDLKQGVLRAVGDPALRFSEDALRILRALRLCSEHGFVLEEQTRRAARAAREKLKLVARERLFSEFCRLLTGRFSERVLLEEREILAVTVPQIVPAFDFEQRSKYHLFDVYTHTVKTVSAAPRRVEVRLAAFYHDLGKPHVCVQDSDGSRHFPDHAAASEALARESLSFFGAPKAVRETVAALCREHGWAFAATPRGVRRALARFGEDFCRDLLALARADNESHSPSVRQTRRAELTEFERLLEEELAARGAPSLSALAVGGADLIGLGLSPSPLFGEVLRALLSAVVEGEVKNEKEALLSLAKKLVKTAEKD